MNVPSRLLVLFVGVAGCATAGDPNANVTVDAPANQRIDAPANQRIDAPDNQRIDAPHAQGVDAPMQSGTCADPTSGVLATWTFTGDTGAQATTAAASTATGVTATDLTRSSGLTAATGSNSMSSSGWSQAASFDSSKAYYSLTLTPESGCAMDVTALAVDAKASGTGPADGAAATSVDSFGATATVPTNATSTPALTVSGATGAVEIRIYGYAATSASGTFRIQNTFTVSGALR